jgi:hypothetical protein
MGIDSKASVLGRRHFGVRFLRFAAEAARKRLE